MRRVLKLVGIALVAIVVVLLGSVAWAMTVAKGRYEKKWDVHDASFAIPWELSPTELDSLKLERIAAGASAKDPLAGVDLAAVALQRAASRGQYLVDSRLGCKGCHGDDLGGKVVIDVPMVGYWVAPNLTSGQGSITRGFTARDWDLAVRHGVRHDGRTSSMPSEEFTNLSDHELSDVATYIQSVPAVDRQLGPVRLGPVFSFIVATDPNAVIAFKLDHHAAHLAEPPGSESAAVLGEHIVQVCSGCHGANLSGGKMAGDPNMPIVANLTPHASGLQAWTEADFMKAMREGKRPDGSAISEQMPWRVYGQMRDAELAAVWAYLKTVPSVPKGTKAN